MDYAWIPKLLRDAAFTGRPSWEFGYLNCSSCIRKSIILMFLSSLRDKFTLLCKPQWKMFLLVSGRHGHQHGVSTQISINLGKQFLRISCVRKIAVTWILARVLCIYLLSVLSFWTLSIERFWFWFWSILNGVTLKTSNSKTADEIIFSNVNRLRFIQIPSKWLKKMRNTGK